MIIDLKLCNRTEHNIEATIDIQLPEIEAAPVSVYYKNNQGEIISETVILNGNIGATYKSEKKEIIGWNLPEIPLNAEGVFTKESQEVIYIYEAETTETTETIETGDTSDETATSEIATDQGTTSSSSETSGNKESLPQTGEKIDGLLVVGNILVICSLLIIKRSR